MQITREKLSQSARSLIRLFNEENICSIEDTQKLLGRMIPVRDSSPDYVETTLRPSNLRTRALTISYTLPYIEIIPLEIKVNPTFNYAQIIIKMLSEVQGYRAFSGDVFANITQYRPMMHASWRDIIGEVKKLGEM
jgi:hypothetical protein